VLARNQPTPPRPSTPKRIAVSHRFPSGYQAFKSLLVFLSFWFSFELTCLSLMWRRSHASWRALLRLDAGWRRAEVWPDLQLALIQISVPIVGATSVVELAKKLRDTYDS